MAVFANLKDSPTYMEALKEIENAKEAGYSLEIKKFHPIATNQQKAYLNFIITYLSGKIGQTFYQTLSEIQKNVAPHVFMTGEYDKHGYPKFKSLGLLNTAEASSVIRNIIDYALSIDIMLPEQNDELAMNYCQRDIESNKGWV